VCIVVFAKAPEPGRVKTRLIPALGAAGAADLAGRMLTHTLGEALAAGVGPVELCAAPTPADRAWQKIDIPAAVRWSDQGEGDLGQRLCRAAARIAGTGCPLLLIGTDCPALTAPHLREAALALTRADATLLPAGDGGYVLLGLNRYHPSLFEAIPWSTGAVAEATLGRIAALGWSVERGAELPDIDEPTDLCWLPAAWLAVSDA
jgi:hypothetical protein